jgi:hypothetical protein
MLNSMILNIIKKLNFNNIQESNRIFMKGFLIYLFVHKSLQTSHDFYPDKIYLTLQIITPYFNFLITLHIIYPALI